MEDRAKQDIPGNAADDKGLSPRSDRTRKEQLEMCVNTEKKWQHIGKGTRWQTPRAGSALSFLWKTQGALPVFGHHGRTHQPCPREGKILKDKGLGLCHV